MASGVVQIKKTDIPEKWYLISGISESDVVAAYQFINRASWDEAKVNINEGTKYSLTNTLAIWTHCSGLILPPSSTTSNNSTNPSLTNAASSILSCAYSFSIINPSNSGTPGMYIADTRWLGSGSSAHILGSADGWKTSGKKYGQTGVLGANFSSTSKMYFDGTEISLSSASAPYGRSHGLFTVQANDLGSQSGLKVPAIVLYNKALTADQHAEIAWNIAKLGGLL